MKRLNRIIERSLSQILSGGDSDSMPNVLFIGSTDLANDSNFASKLIDRDFISGDIEANYDAAPEDLFRALRKSADNDYDVIVIMAGNSITKSLRRTIRIFEEMYKFASKQADRVIAISNPIMIDVKLSSESKTNDLKELSTWISNQTLTDDTIDISKLGSGFFDTDGNELNNDGQVKLAKRCLRIINSYDLNEPSSKSDKDTSLEPDINKSSGGVDTVVYVDSSDIVTGANFSDSLENQATRLLARFEGFNSTPQWDVDNWRIGHGSSTITAADGTVTRLSNDPANKPNITITRDDAARDLKRRLQDEFIPETLSAISPAGNTLPAGVIAPLVSVTYNYGTLPNSIRNAAKEQNINKIAAAIRARQNDNAGINSKRRNKEANYVLAAGESFNANESFIKLKSLLKKG